MNRHLRRISDAQVKRGQPVSATLLQEQLGKLAAENHQMRTVLCAIIKEQGRVRVSRATVEGLGENDAIQERELPDAFVFEYRKADDMVTPHGVTNGRGNDPPKETA